MRMMAFSMTMPQLLLGMKTVTRRAGWRKLRPNQTIMACNQRMGLSKGQTPTRVAPIHVISVQREPVDAVSDIEAIREGFPHLSGAEFIKMFGRTISDKKKVVTRIAFEPTRLEGIPRMGTMVDIPSVAAFRDTLRRGVVVGHVLPDRDPARLANLVARKLGLQMSMALPRMWPPANAHRALILCDDATLATARVEQFNIMNNGLTICEIVLEHTMDPKIREMAAWKVKSDETCKRGCAG